MVNLEVNTDTSQIIKERNISFLLKVASNVKIIDGTGEQNNPYKLGL